MEADGVGGDLGCMDGEIGVRTDITLHIPVIGNNANHPEPGVRQQWTVIHLPVNKLFNYTI